MGIAVPGSGPHCDITSGQPHKWDTTIMRHNISEDFNDLLFSRQSMASSGFGLQLQATPTTTSRSVLNYSGPVRNHLSFFVNHDMSSMRTSLASCPWVAPWIFTVLILHFWSAGEQVERGPKVWEFLMDLLEDPERNSKIIRWENQDEGIFRIVDKDTVALRWGQRNFKTKTLPYEHFARTLR